jgi:hypothetical protein
VVVLIQKVDVLPMLMERTGKRAPLRLESSPGSPNIRPLDEAVIVMCVWKTGRTPPVPPFVFGFFGAVDMRARTLAKEMNMESDVFFASKGEVVAGRDGKDQRSRQYRGQYPQGKDQNFRHARA